MQMNSSRSSWSSSRIAALVVLLLCSTALFANSTFINGDVPTGTSTTFSDTNNGLTATFSSPADPGGFITGVSFFSFGWQILSDPGPATASDISLDISFSAPQSGVWMDFAIDGQPGPFRLDAYLGGTLVGSTTATGVIPVGYSLPEGIITFSGAHFDSVVLTSSTTPYFAVANINTVPEPSSLILLTTALAGAGGVLRRKLAK